MLLRDQVKALIKGDVADDPQTLQTFSRDASLFEVKPDLVVYPKDVEDIKKLVEFVSQHEAKPEIEKAHKLSLTARSGGTDMSGGPLSQSIVVEFAKYFNHIKQVTEHYAITEPGVYYRDFEKVTLKHDGLMPSYPASREICMVGGMVANNSGGEKTLTYGKTENYVEELHVILSDGNEYILKPLNKQELDDKMKQQDFEGEIYRKVYKLVTDNQALLAEAKPKVSKNSAGYYLWNVWDGQTFNLCKLWVGSQGTFGFHTEIKFRLVKPKKHSQLLVIFLKDFDNLAQITNKVLEYKPESFESYDDNTLKLALRFLPEIIKFFKTKTLISLAFSFLPEMLMTITGGMPKLVLMAEFTGDSEAEIETQAKAAQAALAEFKVKTRLTTSADDAKKYWTIRRESFNLLRHHIRNKHTAPFIDDICVRPDVLPEFLPKLQALMAEYPSLIYTIAGHVGDGNFHIIPLMDFKNPDAPKIIRDLSMKVYDLVIAYKGTITAEHNDGLIRSPYLEKMYGEKVYDLFKEVKKIFDPHNIFNPGKKVGGTLNYSMHHIEKD